MDDLKKCDLCLKLLENDFTTIASQNYIETLGFLKGIKTDARKCHVCLKCFEKVNFVSSFRAQKNAELVKSPADDTKVCRSPTNRVQIGKI